MRLASVFVHHQMTVGISRLAGAVISLALLLAPLTEASGQRTVPGQWLGDAGVSVPLAPGSPASGAWVRAGRYLAGSYWSAGARLAPVSPDGEAGSLLLSGGMMWRLAATRDRLLGLYAGGDVFVGADYTAGLGAAVGDVVSEDGNDAPEDSRTGLTYGVEPRVEAEVFPFRRVGLVAGTAAQVRARSMRPALAAMIYVGIRVNF